MNSVQSTTSQVGEGFFPLAIVESDSMDASKVDPTIIPMEDPPFFSMEEETPFDLSVELEQKYLPVFMISLSAIQTLVKLRTRTQFLHKCGLIYFLTTFGNSPMLLFGYDPHRRHQVWRFILMMLVHTRLCHLITNILLQLVLGVFLEIVHSWLPIATIYFSSVIGGSLFVTLLNPNSYAVGASAGVYGLLASHLSSIILDWNGWNWNFAPHDLDTNYASYVSGAITGFLISILVLKDFKQQKWKKNLRIGCIVILATIFVVAVLVNIFGWNYYLPTEWNKDYQGTYVKFAYERATATAEPSTAREYCKRITKCKLLLNRFDAGAFNSTTPSLD